MVAREVVVIGGGVGGLSAAAMLSSIPGLRVRLLERTATLGGILNQKNALPGIWIPSTRAQLEELNRYAPPGVTFDDDELDAMLEDAEGSIRLLKRLGVVGELVRTSLHGYHSDTENFFVHRDPNPIADAAKRLALAGWLRAFVGRPIQHAAKSARSAHNTLNIVHALIRYVRRSPAIRVELEADVRRVARGPSGFEVYFVDARGEQRIAHGSHLVLATGGFTTNPDALREYGSSSSPRSSTATTAARSWSSRERSTSRSTRPRTIGRSRVCVGPRTWCNRSSSSLAMRRSSWLARGAGSTTRPVPTLSGVMCAGDIAGSSTSPTARRSTTTTPG